MTYRAKDIDGWFETLEEAFEGKLADDHPLIRTFGGQGWRVRTMGVGLLVLADSDFPFSKPRAFIESYDRKRPRPHIEPLPKLGEMARVCLATPTVPDDPLLAVQSALQNARQLLKANEEGVEDEDFANDFGLYWHHYLPPGAKAARLSGLSTIGRGTGAFFYATDETYYCFRNKDALRRYADNLWGSFIRSPHPFPLIELSHLPRPDKFPVDAEQLLTLLKRNTTGGVHTVGNLLRERPKRTLVVFSGIGPNGRTFKVAVELVVRSDAKGRAPVKARIHSKLSDEEAIRLYDVFPLDTRSLDAALTRLPNAQMAATRKKVVIVGCGALGSGIATMLAKAGVTRLVLIDPEVMGWENIRRHELGAVSVGMPKSQALKRRIIRSLPEIEKVVAIETSVQHALEKDPQLLDGADLVISATGDWGSDVFLSRTASSRTPNLPVLYTWTEAFALATHAVLLSGAKGHFTDGFDAVGSFKGKASRAGRKPPPECGNTTSPFGAVEVAQSQAMAAKLALEFLGGRHQEADVWWTRTAEETALEDAEGSWTEHWIESRGRPPSLGGVTEGAWKF